jgi:hypothetical protein
MKIKLELRSNTDSASQRGAALVTVLLISTLLLAMGGTLILVTSLSARTSIDATAEMQAYYSAEAGIQDTLNVLRGNVAPNAAMPAGSKISFRDAVTANKSNRPGDNSTTFRLSGWLNYNYTSTGQSSPDRVGLTAGYNPINGLAYSVTVTDPDNTPVASGEPKRLLLRVLGYGPKGAQKQLELVVNRSNFDYAPPAMLMMVGASDCSGMTFTIGSSNAKDYSGHDHSSTGVLPAFGSTCSGDHDIEMNSDGKETVAAPKAQNVANSDLPQWLRSADEARAFLAEQKSNAITQGRYFNSFSGTSGSSTDPAFTFVDGDCTLDGGGGLIIVTGNLIMKGNPSFDGLILVLGNGHVERDGGGNGDIFGAVTVARFNSTGGFLPPYFDTNGGGTSLMQYDSAAISKALNVSGPRVMGIHEY